MNDALDRLKPLVALLLCGVDVVVVPETIPSDPGTTVYVAASKVFHQVQQAPTRSMALQSWRMCFALDVLLHARGEMVAHQDMNDDDWLEMLARQGAERQTVKFA